MKTIVIAAFPGTGKSYFVVNLSPNGKAIDLDTNAYTDGYDEDGKTVNREFPANYLIAIKQAIGQTEYLFVGCQPDVLNMLHKESILPILVYPERQLKDEYTRRFHNRGSSEGFSNLVLDNWDQFLDYLETQDGDRIVLKSGQYISDVIDKQQLNLS